MTKLGFTVVGLGCYNREFARDLRAAAAEHGVEPLITDDYLEVEAAIEALSPELVLGTQMERHIAKRFRIPCAVISAPVHVQDFPARHSPQMGWEGANVLFDSWVHPLVMGLEEHLLTMFRDDFEFSDSAGASHLGHASAAARVDPARPAASENVGETVSADAPVLSPTHDVPVAADWLVGRSRKGIAQDPVLRAWESAAEHRALMPASKASPRSRSTRSTMRRRIMPASSAIPVRVVIITLDNHLSGAVMRAQEQFARSHPGVTIGFHAAADWDERPEKLAAARADIERGRYRADDDAVLGRSYPRGASSADRAPE